MNDHDVVVVGAGPAGLGAAARLLAAGFDPIILDRADSVGATWRTRYDSFRLHTIRWLSNLPGTKIPSSYGPWVRRDDFVAYLESYAFRFGIRPRLGVALQEMRPDGAGGWVLSTSDGTIATRRVVLATGACNEPGIPDWPGRATFQRPLIHSSEYRNPRPYAGQRILVVGAGNSAAEIATDLASTGQVTVEMAVRTPPTIVRRDTRGIPTQPLGIALRHMPAAFADPLAAALRRITIPDLTGHGLPPPAAPFSQFQRTHTVPVLDHGFVDAVRSGAIGIRSAVSELDGREVVHADGSRSTPEVVIAATGYTAGLEPILGPLGLIDSRGLPAVGARGDRARAAGLYTIAIQVLLSGLLREITRDSARLVRALTGAWPPQPGIPH